MSSSTSLYIAALVSAGISMEFVTDKSLAKYPVWCIIDPSFPLAVLPMNVVLDTVNEPPLV